ncbi:MAG: hypothetical protein H6Q73_4094 [Firmicutes bacterium]|nr:hypothetical protein [Bacillota bacterium]
MLNVIIALVFRLTVGGVLTIFGTAGPVIVVAGPIGSFTARLLLGGVIGKAAVPLIIAALPGAGYTALAAWPLTIMLNRVKKTAEKRSRTAGYLRRSCAYCPGNVETSIFSYQGVRRFCKYNS